MHYTPQPLPGFESLVAIDSARFQPASERAEVTLSELQARLHSHSPKIAVARARHATATARADIDEPWPDPSFSVGPQIATGKDRGNSLPSLLAGLTLRLPLGDRLAAASELDRVIARQLELDAILVVREEELAMRGAALAVHQAKVGADLSQGMLTAVEHAVRVGERSIEAGSMTASGVAVLRRLLAEQELEQAATSAKLANARSDLASRLAANADAVGTVSLALETPSALPSREELRRRLADRRPALLRKRAEYAVAEATLRFEVAQQWPDLSLSPGFNDEPGEDRNVFSLGLGITLPIFDRNRKDIAQALAQRDQVRIEYFAEVQVALADLDRAMTAAANAERLLGIARDHLLPAAESAFQTVRQSLDAGTTSALDVIDAVRGRLRARAAVLEAESAWLQAVVALEQVIGDAILELEADVGQRVESDVTPTPTTEHPPILETDR